MAVLVYLIAGFVLYSKRICYMMPPFDADERIATQQMMP